MLTTTQQNGRIGQPKPHLRNTLPTLIPLRQPLNDVIAQLPRKENLRTQRPDEQPQKQQPLDQWTVLDIRGRNQGHDRQDPPVPQETESNHPNGHDGESEECEHEPDQGIPGFGPRDSPDRHEVEEEECLCSWDLCCGR